MFHVVVAPEGQPPLWQEVSTREELLALLRDLPREGFVYIFEGRRLLLTSGRHLIDGADYLPVDVPGPAGQPVEDGRLGEEDIPDSEYLSQTQLG